MFDIKGKTVTIIGAQRSGRALARLIAHHGGRPQISEQAALEKLDAAFVEWMRKHKFSIETGGHTPAFIEAGDVLVLSPGVRPDAPVVEGAKKKGILILGEIECAFQFCRAPIIAVTGSNGKTTTVTLITQVLQAAGYRVSLCGNIGIAFSEHMLDPSPKDYIVLEVSSFQTEVLLDPSSPFRKADAGKFYVKGFRPKVAVVLNFSQNHLDRHADMEDYFRAKTRIFLNQAGQDYAVLNDQDEKLKSLAPSLTAQVKFFNRPASTSDAAVNPNHSAVITVAEILGIPAATAKQVCDNFKGVEHRCEQVEKLRDVIYINDSKATTAEATRWALTQLPYRIWLICGGKDKNIDFSTLRDLVRQKVKGIVCIGEAKEKIARTFDGVVPIQKCATLEEAVRLAGSQASRGECVLLSPMCASFDMFTDYEDRGRKYKEIVRRIVSEENLLNTRCCGGPI